MSGMEKWEHLHIPFAKIKEATKDFIKEIGKGGYGSVYEGHLKINKKRNTEVDVVVDDGEVVKVAVKRLNEKGQQGLKEFLNEIDLLSGEQHENIITLVGYCDEGNEKIIVYEFAERGSLDFYFRFKNGKYTIPWVQRLKIVVDVARGLDYLHNHLQKKQVIIHRDIKTSNILLDHNWVAKISDFGLSRVTDSERSTVVTYACGTLAYVEPELKDFTAHPKADVYSFGLLLFEVLCGRLCNVKYEEDEILSAKVFEEYYTKGKLINIIDPSLKEQMNPNVLSKFSAIAYKCLLSREQRPKMDVVKKELEETLKIQVLHSKHVSGMNQWNSLRLSFQEIRHATNNFSKEIGRGSFGKLYHGELSIHGIRMKVAVKRSAKEFGQATKEFLMEIQLVSGVQHENLVSLVGYCDEYKEKIIVYEYAERGRLDKYITRSSENYTLTWLERLKIVVGAARGMDHLHNHLGGDQCIIHGDIKSANILLDDKWVAKIFDFGMSKPQSTTLDINSSISALGYLDPEFLSTRTLTKKSDVYSFGVVLFEVFCGKPDDYRDQEITYLASLAQVSYTNNQLDSMIDPYLREQISQRFFKKFSTIAYKCLQAREKRPEMDVVKKELEEILAIEVLHWRSFFSRHWYILNVEDLSPETHIEQKRAERLKRLSISCDQEDRIKEHENK
ncbi:putative protein kinase RLK-Pelle-CrRLK1L-1 family [Helianthus annuus]|nr:putative protein kinase RLK-Pelle-CrRLK1L-1 family [Helianthus annuus]